MRKMRLREVRKTNLPHIEESENNRVKIRTQACVILKSSQDFLWEIWPNLWLFLKKIFLIMYLFIFVCAESSLLYVWAFSSCGAWASHCGGFSCFRAWTLGRSSFGSCGFWASLLHKWNIPRPGIKPLSPMLAGRFTEPPGKSFRNFSSC